MNGERDTAIDFVKLMAIFLVINSHMAICYVKYPSLATGGAIADALFFFASGFTLFLGRDSSFPEWFGRRLSRIYPSVFSVAIITAIAWKASDSFMDVILLRRYWFLQCIIVLYPILFLIKSYASRVWLVFVVAVAVIVGSFPFLHGGKGLFYADGYFRWAVFFLFMLLGAMVGKGRLKIPNLSLPIIIAILIFSVLLWYFVIVEARDSWWQILSIIPLFSITLSLYLFGRSGLISWVYSRNCSRHLLISIGSLCLECYLVQKFIITDKLNNLFPFNILILMIAIVGFSYMVKVFANLLSCLFRSEPFSLKSLFSVF
ncbi:MAG: acyltransferase family protein [Bacteroidales bacterium]|nr:acyltransferase family protein [Bacteroidales bacterium]